MGPDPELGVRQLYELFRERSLEPPDELALLEARLQRNLRERRMYGQDSANSAEWARIMEGLIQLAYEELGVRFNDLCQWRPVQPVSVQFGGSKGDDEEMDELPPSPNYALRRNWAVFVGADDYEDQEHYPSLSVCVADAQALASQFTANGFPAERMQVITGDRPGNRPTRGNILNTLYTTAKATRPDDLLLFYYSGHGDADEDDSYLVASDGWASSLRDTAVPFSRIKQIMQDAPARNKVVILDACHAGVRFESKGTIPMSPRFIRHVFEQAKGFVVLSSCENGQLSYQLMKQGQSVYTYFLLQALQGLAGVEDGGYITVRNVNNYVTDKVKTWAAQQKRLQSPTISSEMSGEIILCSCSVE